MSHKIDWRECDTCRAKPGSPVLCSGCLHNRTLYQSLVAERERWERLKSKIAWHRDGIGSDVPVLQERYDKLIKERNELRAEQEQLRQVIRDEITAIRIWQHAIHPRSDVQEGLAISLSKLESALNEQRSTSE